MIKPYRHKVQYYETDKMGIVHHSNYIRWMEEARIDFLDQIGWSFDRIEQMGIVSPVMYVDCRYRVSTVFADEITILPQVEAFHGVRLKMYYEMRRQDGTLVCQAHSEHCFLDREGKLLRMQTAYPELYAALAAQAVEQPEIKRRR